MIFYVKPIFRIIKLVLNNWPVLTHRFDNGKGHANLRSKERLELNKWSTIRAQRSGVNGKLIINGEDVVIGRSPGSLQQLNVDDVSYIGGMSTSWRQV